MAKLWRKLKWLVFFWDTVYMHVYLGLSCNSLNNADVVTRGHRYRQYQLTKHPTYMADEALVN